MRKSRRRLEELLLEGIGAIATFPFRFRQSRVRPPPNISHLKWEQYLLDHFDKEGTKVLEIGSRNVTGSPYGQRFSRAEYIGFDFYEGDNVDVVGDAHRLSSYFGPEEKFDLIFSAAVFEHLHMPWVVAEEINKLLKVGGYIFVETHFAFAAHERPWNFFQFSDMGLRALFSEALGFELVENGMSNPISGYYAHESEKYLRYRPLTELYCHSEILCRKIREIDTSFRWNDVNIDDIVDGSRYPENTGKYRSG
jgi:SAM-dependent methyltransferase